MAWDLALLDPDTYWECGSGSRSKEMGQNYQINLIFSLSKWVGVLLFWIRIRIGNADPDPEPRKLTKIIK
jgi:hypothetical protein